MSRRVAEQKQALAKFKPPDDPFEIEAGLDMIKPLDDKAKKRMMQIANDLISSGKLTKGEVKALEVWKMTLLTESLPEAVRAEFHGDFSRWLLGRGRESDHKRTPWGRASLADDDEVAQYIDNHVAKMVEFRIKLKLLSMRRPVGIVQTYLYYKYVVRGVEANEHTFLEDWQYMMNEFDTARLNGQDWKDPEGPPHEVAPYGDERSRAARVHKIQRGAGGPDRSNRWAQGFQPQPRPPVYKNWPGDNGGGPPRGPPPDDGGGGGPGRGGGAVPAGRPSPPPPVVVIDDEPEADSGQMQQAPATGPDPMELAEEEQAREQEREEREKMRKVLEKLLQTQGISASLKMDIEKLIEEGKTVTLDQLIKMQQEANYDKRVARPRELWHQLYASFSSPLAKRQMEEAGKNIIAGLGSNPTDEQIENAVRQLEKEAEKLYQIHKADELKGFQQFQKLLSEYSSVDVSHGDSITIGEFIRLRGQLEQALNGDVRVSKKELEKIAANLYNSYIRLKKSQDKGKGEASPPRSPDRRDDDDDDDTSSPGGNRRTPGGGGGGDGGGGGNNNNNDNEDEDDGDDVQLFDDVMEEVDSRMHDMGADVNGRLDSAFGVLADILSEQDARTTAQVSAMGAQLSSELQDIENRKAAQVAMYEQDVREMRDELKKLRSELAVAQSSPLQSTPEELKKLEVIATALQQELSVREKAEAELKSDIGRLQRERDEIKEFVRQEETKHYQTRVELTSKIDNLQNQLNLLSRIPLAAPAAQPPININVTNSPQVTSSPSVAPVVTTSPSNTSSPSVNPTLTSNPVVSPTVNPSSTSNPTVSPMSTSSPVVNPTTTSNPVVSPTTTVEPQINPNVGPQVNAGTPAQVNAGNGGGNGSGGGVASKEVMDRIDELDEAQKNDIQRILNAGVINTAKLFEQNKKLEEALNKAQEEFQKRTVELSPEQKTQISKEIESVRTTLESVFKEELKNYKEGHKVETDELKGYVTKLTGMVNEAVAAAAVYKELTPEATKLQQEQLIRKTQKQLLEALLKSDQFSPQAQVATAVEKMAKETQKLKDESVSIFNNLTKQVVAGETSKTKFMEDVQKMLNGANATIIENMKTAFNQPAWDGVAKELQSMNTRLLAQEKLNFQENNQLKLRALEQAREIADLRRQVIQADQLEKVVQKKTKKLVKPLTEALQKKAAESEQQFERKIVEIALDEVDRRARVDQIAQNEMEEQKIQIKELDAKSKLLSEKEKELIHLFDNMEDTEVMSTETTEVDVSDKGKEEASVTELIDVTEETEIPRKLVREPAASPAKRLRERASDVKVQQAQRLDSFLMSFQDLMELQQFKAMSANAYSIFETQGEKAVKQYLKGTMNALRGVIKPEKNARATKRRNVAEARVAIRNRTK